MYGASALFRGARERLFFSRPLRSALKRGFCYLDLCERVIGVAISRDLPFRTDRSAVFPALLFFFSFFLSENNVFTVDRGTVHPR